jgi:phenylacetic acid degradation operon negative regulatory protein
MNHMGIKERRTKILAALYFLKDLSFDAVEFTPEVQQTFDISLNPKTKSTLTAMVKEGVIEKAASAQDNAEEADKANPSYKLTDAGYAELCLEFPFCRFLRETWDGKWRILSYEIPEKKREMRDRLRREVSGWGLGPWHRSFWITPHPIIPNLRALVSEREEESYIQAFESEHVFGDRNVLIEKVWQTSVLEKKYRTIFKTWHDILASGESKYGKLGRIIAEYIIILRQDPGLPSQLLGSSWIGYEAFKIYKEIRSILTSA